MLEIQSTGLFNINYLVFRDGSQLARIQPKSGPLGGHFEWQRSAYTIAAPASEGMLRGLQRCLVRREVHELRDGQDRIIASARRRGWADGGHTIDAPDGPCALDWDDKGAHFRLRKGGIDVATVRRTHKARCSIAADLPESMPLPLQVFVGMLGLAHWETWSNT